MERAGPGEVSPKANEICRQGHRGRASLAKTLSKRGLDDVSDLLRDLNEARKSVAYGDIGLPELDAEEVASRIEAYIDSISALIGQGREQ